MLDMPFRAKSRDAEAMVDALDRSLATIEFDPNGTIITANENFLRVIGYRLDEIQGRHHSMFAEPGFANSAEYKSFWDSLASGRFQAGEYKRIGKGGKEIWLEATYNPVIGRNGKTAKVVKFATDVSEKKREAAELKGLVNAISRSQAVIEFKLDGKILTANENFLSVIGYRLEEIQGKHHSLFVESAFRDSAEYRAFWAALGRGEFQAAQYKRIGKGGKEVWIEASYNPIFDLSGKPYKVVKFATDLSKRKAENAQLADQFERDVKGLVDTVSAAATELQAAAETLTAGAEVTNQRSVTGATATEELTASITEISRQLSSVTSEVESTVGCGSAALTGRKPRPSMDEQALRARAMATMPRGLGHARPVQCLRREVPAPRPRSWLDSPCTCILTLTFPLRGPGRRLQLRDVRSAPKQALAFAPKGLASLKFYEHPCRGTALLNGFPQNKSPDAQHRPSGRVSC